MEQLKIHRGPEITVKLPSGEMITIREQTAADDDILNFRQQNDIINAINRFIVAIVTEYKGKAGITLDQVHDLKLRDKYYILLQTRIHSIGEDLTFKYTCQNDDCKTEFEIDVDLKEYLMTEDGTENDKAPTPYPDAETEFEIELASGKKFKMDYLNGHGEAYALRAAKDKSWTRNSELFSRNIKTMVAGEWTKITSLNTLSKKEGLELHTKMSKVDAQFLMGAEITCPECGNREFLPFIAIPDFFFPVGI